MPHHKINWEKYVEGFCKIIIEINVRGKIYGFKLDDQNTN